MLQLCSMSQVIVINKKKGLSRVHTSTEANNIQLLITVNIR